MIKKLAIITSLVALTGIGCQKQMSKMTERLDAIDKRLEQLEKRPTAPVPSAPPAQQTAYNLPVGMSPVLGNKSAAVSIVVFSDFQCPFCARVDPLIQDAIKDSELKDKVNVVYKHFPLSFHQNAKPAAKASLAAADQGMDKFWKMATKMYENQTQLTAENYKKWAAEVGCNVKKFEADLKSNDARYEEMIKKDMELGMNEAKVRGTPSIYVGGYELRDRSVDGIKSLMKEKKLL